MTIRSFAGLSLAASLIFAGAPVFASDAPAAQRSEATWRQGPATSGSLPAQPAGGSEKTQILAITDGSGHLTQTGRQAELTAPQADAQNGGQADAHTSSSEASRTRNGAPGQQAKNAAASKPKNAAASGVKSGSTHLTAHIGSVQPNALDGSTDGSQPSGTGETSAGTSEKNVPSTPTESGRDDAAQPGSEPSQAGAEQSGQGESGQPAQPQPNQPGGEQSQTGQPEAGQSDSNQSTPAQGSSAGAPDGYLFMSEPLAVDQFAVAGLTWNKGQSLPGGATVEMRTLDATGWSDWYVLSVEEDDKGRPGTEANISGGSTGVQIRIKGSGNLPAGLAVNLLNGQGPTKKLGQVQEVAPSQQPSVGTLTQPVANPDEEQAIRSGRAAGVGSTSQFGAAAANSTSHTAGRARTAVNVTATRRNLTRPQIAAADMLASIHPRSAWGADESKMAWPRSYQNFEGAIVHHTAGSNNYSQAQVPATIRGIYGYHAITRGWGDIGYNVLIDKYGGRWEGRSGTLEAPHGKVVTGAHAAPRNQGTFGISVLGTYNSASNVTPLILETFSDVIAARFALGGVDPNSQGTMRVPSGTGAALQAGTILPRIVGHKDVKSTACPAAIYGFLDQIRAATAAKYQKIMGTAVAASAWKPAKQPSPTYYLNNAWSGNATHTFAYGRSSDVEIVGDWDGDGKDTVSLRRGNTFAVNNVSAPTASPKFDAAYGIPGDEYYVGDWDGDGKDSLAVRRGNVFHISNRMGSSTADQTIAYGKPGDTVMVGDWDGDGKDTFAVRRGNQYHIRNTISSGVADKVVPYGRSDDEVFVGHFGGSAKDALAVRRGKTFYVSNHIHNGDADRVIDYGRVGDRAFVGDWDGDRVDTFGVRRG